MCFVLVKNFGNFTSQKALKMGLLIQLALPVGEKYGFIFGEAFNLLALLLTGEVW